MQIPQFFFPPHFAPYEDVILRNGGISLNIPKNKIISNANELPHVSYYIKKGIAKLAMINEIGTERILFFFHSGSIYPITRHQELLTMENYLHLVAITDIEAIAFPSERILDMMESNRGMCGAVIDHSVHYENTLLTKILLRSYNDSDLCVSSFLYLWAKYHQSKNAIVHLSQEQIGQIIGLSRIQTIRVLNALQEEGLIIKKNRSIQILNPERLLDRCSDVVRA